MSINYVDYDSYFDEDVADNFCILKRNIEIQIDNIKSVMTSRIMNKKQIKGLSRSLEQHRSLLNRTKEIDIGYRDVFMLMLEFKGLARKFDTELSKIDNSLPVMFGLEEFVEMYGDEYYRHIYTVCLN